ncbi:sigma factor-like helix-turn-helix DNA-binding protein [Klebsiella aerogenes]|uniref:sigma factor-like helix-turn-helix DNA-binding protein n=1 Tax=Klebsiella TaxID=570 RepID=UPI000C769DD8|nr:MULTISPECIES: sigma factor-like helix-turn-helix DNA-binding protein [Klebsiella]MCJ1877167.1 hypothetical protein [Klebsiella sp. HSTU-Sny5]HBV9245640.1 sigma-70 family RNA polymerase sigma factor [Klebsiella aerogenes]
MENNSIKVGRPFAIETTSRVQELKGKGWNQRQIAELMGVSIRTVKRHWKRAVNAVSLPLEVM